MQGLREALKILAFSRYTNIFKSKRLLLNKTWISKESSKLVLRWTNKNLILRFCSPTRSRNMVWLVFRQVFNQVSNQHTTQTFDVGRTKHNDNSTLRYECDETFSDECEFAARAEGEWWNHTCQENVFRTSIVRNFISRGVK